MAGLGPGTLFDTPPGWQSNFGLSGGRFLGPGFVGSTSDFATPIGGSGVPFQGGNFNPFGFDSGPFNPSSLGIGTNSSLPLNLGGGGGTFGFGFDSNSGFNFGGGGLQNNVFAPSNDNFGLQVDPIQAGLTLNALLFGDDPESSQASDLSPLNPSFGTIANLFGLEARGGELVDDPNNAGLFGADFKTQLLDFMSRPLLPSEGEFALIDQILGDPEFLVNRLAETDAALGNIAANALIGANTGFRVDTQGFFDEASRRFTQHELPQIAETAGAGFGLGSTAFTNTAGLAASELGGQAALAAIDADEQAAGRRLNSLLPAAQIAGTRAALPFALTSDALALGQNFRGDIESGRARPLNVFSAISGLAGPGGQGFFQPGHQTTDATAGLLGALASNLPDLNKAGSQSGFNAFG